MPSYTIYTDGCCLRNPGGAGGAAAIIQSRTRCQELHFGYLSTTNNRMEILAAIHALEVIEPRSNIILYSDSRYLVNAVMKKWIQSWKYRGWVRHTGDPVKNPDLWKRLDALMEGHAIEFKWLRGHNGHQHNERCDYLAGKAALKGRLVDEGYIFDAKEEPVAELDTHRALDAEFDLALRHEATHDHASQTEWITSDEIVAWISRGRLVSELTELAGNRDEVRLRLGMPLLSKNNQIDFK